MIRIKNKIILFGTLLLGVLFLSNASQPGIWNAGGGGSFQLLYPEDSLAYKKIQMQSEAIYMQLYKGFGVVKGEYNFINSTDSIITIKVGYPINNVFPRIAFSQERNEVVFDDLYKIKGAINGIEMPLLQSPNEENDNWYVWELTFPPKEILKFNVHFLVNTNNSKTVKGYTNDYKNGFIYLIETGSLWKSPIEKGDFFVNFMDDISVEDCKISAPANLNFNTQQKILHFQLENYGLEPDKNLIITYTEKNENFDFKSVVNESDNYFEAINLFSSSNLNIPFESISFKDPYNPDKSWSVIGFILSTIIFVLNYFTYFLLAFIGLIILIIYRNKKRK